MIAVCQEIESILSSLRSDDPPVTRETRLAVIDKLRRKDPTEVAAVLTEALQDCDPDFRCEIASVFLAADFARALEPIRSALLNDLNDGVRYYLCELLGASRRREAIPLLENALLHDTDSTTRIVAVSALRHLGDPTAIPALQRAMQNDTGVDYEGRPVKDIAAEAIRRIQEKQHEEML